MADMKFFRENIVVRSLCEQIHTQHATQYATHIRRQNRKTQIPFRRACFAKRKTAATNLNPKTNHTPCARIDGSAAACRWPVAPRYAALIYGTPVRKLIRTSFARVNMLPQSQCCRWCVLILGIFLSFRFIYSQQWLHQLLLECRLYLCAHAQNHSLAVCCCIFIS